MNVPALLRMVADCGYRVKVEGVNPTLVKSRTDAEMPGPLLKALKDNRDAVVAYLTECSQCGRNNGDPEDRDRLREVNPFCRETPCPFRGNAC